MKTLLRFVFLYTTMSAGLCMAQNTHMGVPPKSMVTLQISCVKGVIGKIECIFKDKTAVGTSFIRTHEDGSIEADNFVIPAGQYLAVTDIDWSFQDNSEKEEEEWQKVIGKKISIHMGRASNSDSSKANRALASEGVLATGTCDGDFPFGDIECSNPITAAGNIQATSGFLVAAGASLRIEVSLPYDLKGLATFRAFVRGYLLPGCTTVAGVPCE